MTDTTTIEITEEQRDELKACKIHDRESYKSVIDRLLSTSDMGRVYEPTIERFNDHKADARADDMPELSGDSFLNTLLDTYESVQENGSYDDADVTHAEKQLAEAWDTAARGGIPDDDLREQLDRIESATGDESVDTEALGREVARQIDYAHLSDRVSEQVARELGR